MSSLTDRRLETLDGLRCLAVIPVVIFHYLYFWTPAGAGLNIVAYGDKFANFPLASVGFLGVHLFFVISGFVIFLTLEKTSSLREFLIRRAIRLWPPIIMFGTLTFLTVALFGPPQLAVSVYEYVISLMFVPPEHVGKIFSVTGWKWLDGAYWSLWVEVRFYAIIGIIYFLKPAAALTRWMMFEVLTIGIGVAQLVHGGGIIDRLDGLLFQQFVPYFSFGIACYMAFTGRRGTQVLWLTGLALVHLAFSTLVFLSSASEAGLFFIVQFIVGQFFIVGIFYLIAWRNLRLRWLELPVMVRIGQSSYGIYLLHQNFGITILAAPIFAAVIPGAVGVIGVTAMVILLAWFSFIYIEKPLQRWLRRRADRLITQGTVESARST